MSKSRYIFITLSFVLTVFAFIETSAQNDVLSLKNEVNQIKKNSQYIYGEGIAETYEDAEKLAEIRLLENLTEYIKSVPDLDEADVVIVPPIRKELKKITFDRTAKRKVTFLYILKSEIVPLMKEESVEEMPVMVDLQDNAANSQQTDSIKVRDDEFASVSDLSDIIVTVPIDSIVTEPIEISIEKSSADEVTINFDRLTDKELSIIQQIISLDSFDSISEYLINRKVTRHDILYKGCNSFTAVSEPGIWIVFNSKRELIAILNKDKQSKIYSKTSEQSDFQRNGKVWLKIK